MKNINKFKWSLYSFFEFLFCIWAGVIIGSLILFYHFAYEPYIFIILGGSIIGSLIFTLILALIYNVIINLFRLTYFTLTKN